MISERVLWGSLLASLLILVAPGAWDGTFGGTPLTLYARVVLAGLVACASWAALLRPARVASRRVLWILCGCLALKCVVGVADGPTGWMGRYIMLDTSPPRAAPFFARFQLQPFRIDRDLGFQGREFQLHFLNDVLRYNDPKFGFDRTEVLPLGMTWSTSVDVTRVQTLALTASATGDLETKLDRSPLELTSDGDEWTAIVDLSPGRHELVVTYRKPSATPAAIAVRVLLDGAPADLRAFAERPPLQGAALVSDGLVLASVGLLLYQMWLAFGPRLQRLNPRLPATPASAVVTWLVCVLVLGNAMVLSLPHIASTSHLGAQDDPLAYESHARNIMEEGLLMPLGKPVGAGEPYFYYPLYSYALAGAHWLVGEDYGAVILFNGICSIALPLLMWAMGWRRLGLFAQTVGMIALSWLIVRHSGFYWQAALADNLFIPLAIAAVWVSALATRPGCRASALAAGCISALAGSARPSFLLFVGAFVVLLVGLARRLDIRERMIRAALFVGAYAVTLLPFLIRNYIMSGQAVLVVTLSHVITHGLVPPEGGITPPSLSTWPPPWSEALWGAAQMFKSEPALLVWLEIRKALFTLGFTNLGPSNVHLQYEFPVLLALFASALWLKRVPSHLLLAIAAFLISHIAATVIAYPWTYGYKNILPVQYLFLFCALYLTARQPARATRAPVE